jgi:hypothetical protein
MNHHVSAVLALALAGPTAACVASEPDDPSLGTVNLELVGGAASGATYRLRNAMLTVTGPGYSRVWNTEDAPDVSLFSDQVQAGDYTATLADGWSLERVVGSSTVPVPAELTSDNPAAFTVRARTRTTVPLQFHADADTVDMAAGYDVTLTVDEPAPPGELIVTGTTGTSTSAKPVVEVFSSIAAGDTAPVRQVIGTASSTTATFLLPGRSIIVGDQLIVPDQNNVIHFFPASASGSASPIKQIIGTTTKLNSPYELTAFNGELYVMQRDGVLVFKLTDIGNVAPTRSLVLGDAGTNRHFTVDNGEIYVSTPLSTDPKIRVYSATAPSAATRVIGDAAPGFCPGNLVITGGELFAVDACSGGIVVFPEATNATVIPTRVIRGSNTGLANGLGTLAVFQSELYVISGTSIKVFPVAASGNAIANRTLAGAHTALSGITGISFR